MVVTFWDKRSFDGVNFYPIDGEYEDFYVEVYIDIKSKTVLKALEPPN